MKTINVLFVCTGNTCRSAMAQICFQSLISKSDQKRFSILSAGLSAYEGGAASEMAKKVVDSQGLSLAEFRSSMLTWEIIEKASIIIVMTESHLNQIMRLYPTATEKTFLLMSFLGKDEDLLDPYGGDQGEFQACYFKMKPALEALNLHLFSHYLD